ncbi:hypothetical protein BD324DRAFT_635578 [Kockovaella imperatae]|uniref:Uncharacterized protein n=1 Tax=Kockovaella imperatae TaxID=4999 RepID=A0A1Y1UBA5_9TREE|nr:hypothetical protein BD324DRAFT_635578 [Kockovaella imperatae]ORX34365.1 hypothetical protein BD324DRAFT_635578 [Kockovaella imperatae]
MDEALFLFSLFCGALLFFAVIWCFLSTCLGIKIRRSDIWEAFSLPSMEKIKERDRQRRARAARMHEAGEYELDTLDGGGIGPGMGPRAGLSMGGLGTNEDLEFLRRPGSRYY